MGSTERRPRGLTIFRASEAEDLMASGLMSAPQMSDETRDRLADVVGAGSATGAEVKVLARQPTDAGGFNLVHIWFKPNYPLPRHTHDADCMYYVISGSLTMGNQELRAGDAFFVPAEAPYVYDAGPEGVEVLEIRHDVARFDMKIPDAGADRWAAMRYTVVSQRDAWAQMPESPTVRASRRAPVGG